VVKELLERGNLREDNIKSNLKNRNEIHCDGPGRAYTVRMVRSRRRIFLSNDEKNSSCLDHLLSVLQANRHMRYVFNFSSRTKTAEITLLYILYVNVGANVFHENLLPRTYIVTFQHPVALCSFRVFASVFLATYTRSFEIRNLIFIFRQILS
jgi:hypothetical protein